jgi:YfiR/HmsC-like
MNLGRFLASIVMALCLITPAWAQERLLLVEQEIKAGLLYNFLRYTDWPADGQEGPLVVCIYGRDPFDGRLAPIAGRTVNQRSIALRTVRRVEEAPSCSLIFVNAEERADWPHLQAALAGRAVLTASDIEGFATAGGMIEFIHIGNRIAIRINRAAVAHARLSVQDRLLRLAEVGG